jgi:hypothetical protein
MIFLIVFGCLLVSLASARISYGNIYRAEMESRNIRPGEHPDNVDRWRKSARDSATSGSVLFFVLWPVVLPVWIIAKAVHGVWRRVVFTAAEKIPEELEWERARAEQQAEAGRQDDIDEQLAAEEGITAERRTETTAERETREDLEALRSMPGTSPQYRAWVRGQERRLYRDDQGVLRNCSSGDALCPDDWERNERMARLRERFPERFRDDDAE